MTAVSKRDSDHANPPFWLSVGGHYANSMLSLGDRQLLEERRNVDRAGALACAQAEERLRFRSAQARRAKFDFLPESLRTAGAALATPVAASHGWRSEWKGGKKFKQ